MAADVILEIVKARLGRRDTVLDEYLSQRISAVKDEMRASGIRPSGSTRDNVLIADTVVWQYQNRDKGEGMPEWLRLARRERWLQENGGGCQ